MTLLSNVRASTDTLNIKEIIDKYPWIIEKNQKCIISPDADGQLCGLLLSHVLGWDVVGFYDGKVLLCREDISPREAVYLDMEIFRDGVKSMGNHMLLFNSNRKPESWSRFDSCISLNNFRNHDRRKFNRKYPFATIHALMVLVASAHEIPLKKEAAGPLLFADGVYKILLQYTENSWDWMRYLGVEDAKNPLHRYFLSPDLAVYQLMTLMLEFWEYRDTLSITGQRGDRIAITERGGAQEMINMVECSSCATLLKYDDSARQNSEQFLSYLGELTGWRYCPEKWSWNKFRHWTLAKETLEVTNLKHFGGAMGRNPISFAITAQNRLEIAYLSQQDPFHP